MAVFWMVCGIGVFLVVLGFLSLVYLIPKLTPKSQINTEFLSTRAALWCIVVGLILVVLASVEVSVKDMLRSRHCPCAYSVILENIDVSR
jgi:hypothetical protein